MQNDKACAVKRAPYLRRRAILICCTGIFQIFMSFFIRETGIFSTRTVLILLGVATWLIGLSHLGTSPNHRKMLIMAGVIMTFAGILLGSLFIHLLGRT